MSTTFISFFILYKRLFELNFILVYPIFSVPTVKLQIYYVSMKVSRLKRIAYHKRIRCWWWWWSYFFFRAHFPFSAQNWTSINISFVSIIEVCFFYFLLQLQQIFLEIFHLPNWRWHIVNLNLNDVEQFFI